MRPRPRHVNERTALLHNKKIDEPTPFTASLLIATFVPAMGGLLYGLDSALIQILIASPVFSHTYASDRSALLNWNTLNWGYHCLLVIGVCHAAYKCDGVGRSRCLVWAYGVFALANGLMAIDAIGILVVARLLIGWASGILLVACPCMILELAPTDLRVCLVGFFGLLMTAGQLTAQVLYVAVGSTKAASSSKTAWTTLELDDVFFFIGVISLLLALFAYRLPEPPLWLAISLPKDVDDQGIEAVAFILDRDIHDPSVHRRWRKLRLESAGICSSVSVSPSSACSWMYLWHFRLFTCQPTQLLTSCALVLALQLTGADSWMKIYAPAILYAAGLHPPAAGPSGPSIPTEPSSPVLQPLIVSGGDSLFSHHTPDMPFNNPYLMDTTALALTLAAMAISLGWFAEHARRQSLLSTGTFLMALCQCTMGLLVYGGGLKDWATGTLLIHPQLRPILLLCVYFFIAVYAFTWKSAWLVTCIERFPTCHRGRFTGVIVGLFFMAQWLCQACPPWHLWFSPSFIYFFYGAMSFLSSYLISSRIYPLAI
ncbi:MFS general substrate transporter [Hesseltinella vesiculosa]|uniref:MFS general substrate transporter n=1 Tax=Hesseltinella vesiculosa TaxID=101127 RepID=A0A1X2GEI4_9FUNG|nr:MFS general substrate transporter [Hesseltinella vesiculosa]